MSFSPPSSILIIGSGVFGLSTALSLARRPAYANTTITVLDRSPFPSPDGSSVDSSRIIRADYSSPPYAALAAKAQSEWRKTGPGEQGGDGRYTESGLVLVADANCQGEQYVQKSWDNVRQIMRDSGDEDAIQELPKRAAIDHAVNTGGGSGEWGYLNRRSGWADAEAAMLWLRDQVDLAQRVTFEHGEATRLLRTISTTSTTDKQQHQQRRRVHGALLKDGRTIHADLVIIAAGAWSGGLVDLRGRVSATGQVLAYLDLTAAEQAHLQSMPIVLNMSTGHFVIPPRDRCIKVARHAYGYLNPVRIPNPDVDPENHDDGYENYITVSLPLTTHDTPTPYLPLPIPPSAAHTLRKALTTIIPSLFPSPTTTTRPFSRTRTCWYADTPQGDFLITYHPDFDGLFLATGGSGHGFKFLGVIGDEVVDCVEGRGKEVWRGRWGWGTEKAMGMGREGFVVTEDGSRGGRPGLLLREEMAKGGEMSL